MLPCQSAAPPCHRNDSGSWPATALSSSASQMAGTRSAQAQCHSPSGSPPPGCCRGDPGHTIHPVLPDLLGFGSNPAISCPRPKRCCTAVRRFLSLRIRMSHDTLARPRCCLWLPPLKSWFRSQDSRSLMSIRHWRLPPSLPLCTAS